VSAVRVGIWLPWEAWLFLIVVGFPLYLVWACIAVATFVVVTLVSWPLKRSLRKALNIGGLTFAWMLAPQHMTQRHNTIVMARTVRGSV
jgi:hypothetical protein